MVVKILTCWRIYHNARRPLHILQEYQNLHNFTSKTPCSKYQCSSIYHRLLHIPARYLRSYEEGYLVVPEDLHKTFDESHLFRCRCRMEQIAK